MTTPTPVEPQEKPKTIFSFIRKLSVIEWIMSIGILVVLLFGVGALAYSLRNWSSEIHGVRKPNVPWVAEGMVVSQVSSGWVKSERQEDFFQPEITLVFAPVTQDRGEILINFVDGNSMPMGDTISFYYENGRIRGQDSMIVTVKCPRGITGNSYMDEYLWGVKDPWRFYVSFKKPGQRSDFLGSADVARLMRKK